MTKLHAVDLAVVIIPYQELLGNYDILPGYEGVETIIPYQELLGNYDRVYVRGSIKALYHTKSY